MLFVWQDLKLSSRCLSCFWTHVHWDSIWRRLLPIVDNRQASLDNTTKDASDKWVIPEAASMTLYIYIYVRLKKKLPTMWAKWCRGYQADLVLWSESASYRSSQLEPFCSATPLGRLPAGAQRGKAVGQAEPCHQMAGCWQRKPLGGSS